MNDGIIEGQISIFELPIEDIKHKKKNHKEPNKLKNNDLNNIINMYSANCSRIVKTYSGALLVELDEKTLYFNSHGINEFELLCNVGIMPGEEIIIANKDKELNSIQMQKLEELRPKEYIKRKGDANIIIPGEKATVINPKGWILEYTQKPKYHENEIFYIEDLENKAVVEKDINPNTNYEIGDKVNIQFQGVKLIGRVVRIYNKDETVNVSWDGKETAFYYKNIEKVK